MTVKLNSSGVGLKKVTFRSVDMQTDYRPTDSRRERTPRQTQTVITGPYF